MPLRRRIILTRRVGCSVALSYYLRRGLCLMDPSEVVFFRMIRCAVRGTIPSRGLRSQPSSNRTTVLPPVASPTPCCGFRFPATAIPAVGRARQVGRIVERRHRGGLLDVAADHGSCTELPTLAARLPVRCRVALPGGFSITALPVATGRIRPRDNHDSQDGRPCSRRLQVLPARASAGIEPTFSVTIAECRSRNRMYRSLLRFTRELTCCPASGVMCGLCGVVR